MNNVCLGLPFLGSCIYDPANPPWRIISLGDTIAAISLVLAFSQLLTPTLKYRINSIFPKVYVLWAIAVVFIVTASILPLLPGEAWPLLGYPIFWELIGAALIVSGICMLLWKFTSQLKFKASTVRQIKGLVVRVIATGDEKDLAELALSLQRILKDLVSSLNLYDGFEAEMARRENRKYEVPQLSLEADNILKLCSDQSFCFAVVRKQPGFAITLIHEIQKQKAYNNNLARPLLWEIMRQAIMNEDSILYREEKYRGLGYTRGFTKIAFTDPEFNEEALPLSLFNFSLEKKVTTEQLDRFGDILAMLTKAYLEQGRFYEHSYSINGTFGMLLGYATSVAYRVDSFSEDELYRSEPYRALSSIARSLETCIKILAEDERLADEQLVNQWKNVPRDRDYSIYERTADWLYKLMEALSHTRKYDEAFRFILIGPWMEIYPVTAAGAFRKEVQWRLEEKIFEQLKVNLEEGYYPAISRPLISVLGLYSDERPREYSRLKEKFFAYLREHFLNLYKVDRERALDKLPATVTFEPRTRRLIQRVGKRIEREFEF